MKKGFLLNTSYNKKKVRKPSDANNIHGTTASPSITNGSANSCGLQRDDYHEDTVINKKKKKKESRPAVPLSEEEEEENTGIVAHNDNSVKTTMPKRKSTRCSSLLFLEDSTEMDHYPNNNKSQEENSSSQGQGTTSSMLNIILPQQNKSNGSSSSISISSSNCDKRLVLSLLNSHDTDGGMDNDRGENTAWIKECSTKWKKRQPTMMNNNEAANYNCTIMDGDTVEQQQQQQESVMSMQESGRSNFVITETSPFVGRHDSKKTTMTELINAEEQWDRNQHMDPVLEESLPSDLSKMIAKLKQGQRKSKNSVVQISREGILQEFFLRYKIIKGHHGKDEKTNKGGEVMRRQVIHFIWDTILEGISIYAKDTKKIFCQKCVICEGDDDDNDDSSCSSLSAECVPPVVWIGYGLLETCPKVSCHEMLGMCFDTMSRRNQKHDIAAQEENEDGSLKRRKVQRLGVMLIVRYYILEMYRLVLKWIQRGDTNCLDKDRGKILGSMDVVLLLLENARTFFQSTLEDKEGTIRRSVLAVNVMDTYFWILEYSSLIYRVALYSEKSFDELVQSMKPLQNNLWNNVPVLEKLLHTLKRWNEESYSDGHSGKHVTTFISSASCVEALLKDWAFVLGKIREAYDKRRLLDMASEEEARLESVEFLARELAGIHLQSNGKGVHCYGGIAQTLCKQSAISIGDILNGLQVSFEAAKSCVFQEQEEIFSKPEEASGENATMVIRHVCGLLSRKKDLVRKMDSDSRTKAVESCLTIMRSKSGRCINLLETVLHSFWSMEDGLPSDLRQLDEIHVGNPIPEDKIPQSVQILTEYLSSYNGDSDSSCQRILSSLLERFLLRKPTLLIPYYLSKAKYSASECKVLVNLLVNREKHEQLTAELCVSIEQHLFKRIDHNKHLQRLIHSEKNIFQSLPLKSVIDKLWDILKIRDPSDLASSAASALMLDTLEQNASKESDAIVCHLIACLSKSHPLTATCNTDPQRIDKSMKFIEKWSKSLVKSDNCGDESFSSIVAACGRAMFQDPSNSLILTLFGTIMDGSIRVDGNNARKRVALAVINIVHLCTLKIEQYDVLDAESDESNLFHRLSPLLLLRRMSHVQFGIADSHGSEEGRKAMMSLARVLAKNLGLSTKHSNSQKLSKEERKLSADIAAVCLPFSNPETRHGDTFSSGFLFFCKDILSATLHPLKNKRLSSIDFKGVKIALYIACHAVQVAPDTFGRTELHFLSKFVLQILNIDSAILSEDIDEPIVELQACCIEFLSTCICAIYSFPKDNHQHEVQGNLIEVIPIDRDVTHEKFTSSNADSIYKDLCIFQNDILALINGRHDLTQKNLAEISLSVSARICLLNALTISCRMCSSESLPELSKTIAPSILAWLTSGEIGDDIRHPLCVASAMQSILHCLQRSKSFDCLEACKTQRKENAVRKLFILSLHCVQSRLKHLNTCEQNTMRLSSLKLLVLIITLNQGLETSNEDFQNNELGLLLPSDITQCFSVLNGLANIDENEEARTLASHLAAIVYAR